MRYRVAKYIRLSNEDRDVSGNLKQESNSVGTQRRLIDAYIMKNKELSNADVAEYCDDGYTGTKFDRPDFLRLIDECKSGNVDCVIVKDFSRFGRDYIEVGDYIDKIFPELGIRFISVNDGFDSNDFRGETGGFEVVIHNLINSYYSKDLSKKVITAKTTRASRGEYVCGFAPYGYLKGEDKSKLIVDETVAPVVKMIFSLACDGMAVSEIARLLNDYEIPTKAAYAECIGKKVHIRHKPKNYTWTASAIRAIIVNETYAGSVVYGKSSKGLHVGHRNIQREQEDWVITPNAHEAIVDRATFEMANKKTGNRKSIKGIARTPNVLFRCAYCGRALRPYNKNLLFCPSVSADSARKCDCMKLDKKKTEDCVLSVVQQMASVFMEESKKNSNKKIVRKDGVSAEELEHQISSLSVKKISMYEAYRAGQYTREAFKKMNDEMAAQIEQLKEKYMELQTARIEDSKENENLEDWEMLAELSSFDVNAIKQVVKEVIVHAPDQLEIIWKSDDFVKSSNEIMQM